MDLKQAEQEYQRWFDYLTRVKEKSLAIQQVAKDRRNGVIDEAEGRRQVQRIDSGATVYDGANLEKAVRVLLNNLKKEPRHD